jgi:hypothetical protein
MVARSRAEIERIWVNVDSVKKLFDRIIPLGPFGGIGLDGMLAWVPGLNILFSAGAGGYLLIQALRARASPGTLLRMATYLGIDTLTDVAPIPLAGAALDTVFQAHMMAANALQKDIESTHWVEGRSGDARASGAEGYHRQQARENGLRRVVYLHD